MLVLFLKMDEQLKTFLGLLPVLPQMNFIYLTA